MFRILLLAVTLALLPGSGRTAGADPRPQKYRLPHLMVGGGVLYAPAPMVQERDGGRTDKLLDRLGWQLYVDWRIFEYMTVGGQLSGLYTTAEEGHLGSSLLEAGFRLGALFPLGDRLALRALVVGGVSGLRTDGSDRVSPYDRRYYGWQVWALAGLVYRLNRSFILYADVSGTTTRYEASTWISLHPYRFEPYDRPNVFRLQFGLGIAICWERMLWRPPRP